LLDVVARRHQPGHLGADQVAPLGVGQVGDDLRDTEHAHRQRHEADAVEQRAHSKGESRVARVHVGADETKQHADEDHAKRLDHRTARQHDREDETKHHQREVVGGRELLRDLGQRRRCERDDDRGDAACEERGERRDGKRRAGAALPRHLVAVETGHDRARLARQVDQNGRGRAAILRAIVDAGQHDQCAFRRQVVGDRQQQCQRRHWTDARQHADRGADDRAGKAPKKIRESDGYGDPESQVVEQTA
jgi:hypothetical protein